MAKLLNQRHELFVQGLFAGKTADQAYEDAGYKRNRKNAARLKANEDILARLEDMQKAAQERALVTRESIAAQLDEDREFARECNQPSAAVSASTAKAKLFGLFVERKEVGAPGDFAHMDNEELDERLAAYQGRERGISGAANGAGKANGKG